MLFMAFGLFAMAQTEVKTVDTELVEPSYVGGTEAMTKHISTNLKYPEDAVKDKIEGIVYTAITINEEGKLIDARVLRGVSESLDAEAIRVIKMMPDWNPGKDASGKPMMARITLPIKFSMK